MCQTKSGLFNSALLHFCRWLNSSCILAAHHSVPALGTRTRVLPPPDRVPVRPWALRLDSPYAFSLGPRPSRPPERDHVVQLLAVLAQDGGNVHEHPRIVPAGDH